MKAEDHRPDPRDPNGKHSDPLVTNSSTCVLIPRVLKNSLKKAKDSRAQEIRNKTWRCWLMSWKGNHNEVFICTSSRTFKFWHSDGRLERQHHYYRSIRFCSWEQNVCSRNVQDQPYFG